MYCNKCKKSFSDDYKFCPICGEVFTPGQPQPVQPNAQPVQPAAPFAQPTPQNAQPAAPYAQPAPQNAQPAAPYAQPVPPTAQPVAANYAPAAVMPAPKKKSKAGLIIGIIVAVFVVIAAVAVVLVSMNSKVEFDPFEVVDYAVVDDLNFSNSDTKTTNIYIIPKAEAPTLPKGLTVEVESEYKGRTIIITIKDKNGDVATTVDLNALTSDYYGTTVKVSAIVNNLGDRQLVEIKNTEKDFKPRELEYVFEANDISLDVLKEIKAAAESEQKAKTNGANFENAYFCTGNSTILANELDLLYSYKDSAGKKKYFVIQTINVPKFKDNGEVFSTDLVYLSGDEYDSLSDYKDTLKYWKTVKERSVN